jgi:hypothetical protein
MIPPWAVVAFAGIFIISMNFISVAVLDIGGNNFPADVIFGARLSTVALGLPTRLTAVPALIIIVGR